MATSGIHPQLINDLCLLPPPVGEVGLTSFLRQLGLDETVIAHDVEGMEHHVSPETFQALEALSRYLAEHPEIGNAIKHV